MSVSAFDDITKHQPERRLLVSLQKHAGRNVSGRITVRHRGGGHRRLYRVIDFRRDKNGVPGKVVAIEYDPNRSARIALVTYRDGDKRYILAPDGVKRGDPIQAGDGSEIRAGHAMPITRIPLGTTIHNIEMSLGRGGQLVRSAGLGAQLLAKDGPYAQVKMPSGEVRRIDVRCQATIGQVGNPDHSNQNWGKAGKSRWRGFRPSVRGMTMNPFDHPHGGGEGRSGAGGHPQTPWGKPALGHRTRHNKSTDKMIVRRRRK